jgi:hypothetical protein
MLPLPALVWVTLFALLAVLLVKSARLTRPTVSAPVAAPVEAKDLLERQLKTLTALGQGEQLISGVIVRTKLSQAVVILALDELRALGLAWHFGVGGGIGVSHCGTG